MVKLKEIIEDIENTCRTCDACTPSCAANIMKVCIERELMHESLLEVLSAGSGAAKIVET